MIDPRSMSYGPTANFVSGQLVACDGYGCEIYNNSAWNHLVDTRSSRGMHSSAVKENRILLIGGHDSRSTEWIPVDGSPSQPGPFHVRHRYGHCTVQVSADVIVVTGGGWGWLPSVHPTEDYVTEYKLTGDGNETPLTPMRHSRAQHACGVYQGAGGQQVRRV